MMIILRRGFCTHLIRCSYSRSPRQDGVLQWSSTCARLMQSIWSQSRGARMHAAHSWSNGGMAGILIESCSHRFGSPQFIPMYTPYKHGVFFEGRVIVTVREIARLNAALRALA